MNVEIDDFSKMDMQHKQLGEIVKAACQVLKNGQGPIEFSGNLNRLVEFTRFHFTAEVSRFPYATMRNKSPINDFCVGLPRLGQRVEKSLSRAA